MKKIRRSTGATFLEMAIGLPVFLILLMGTVDLGLAVDKYLSITRATYEGMRYGAGLWGNEEGCLGPECAQQNSNDNLNFMQGRVSQILAVKGFDAANVKISLNVTKETQATRSNTHTYNVLHITVETPYKAILPFFNLIPLKTTITFTDLYRDDVVNNEGPNT